MTVFHRLLLGNERLGFYWKIESDTFPTCHMSNDSKNAVLQLLCIIAFDQSGELPSYFHYRHIRTPEKYSQRPYSLMWLCDFCIPRPPYIQGIAYWTQNATFHVLWEIDWATNKGWRFSYYVRNHRRFSYIYNECDFFMWCLRLIVWETIYGKRCWFFTPLCDKWCCCATSYTICALGQMGCPNVPWMCWW